MKSIIAATFLVCLLSVSAYSHQKVVVVPLSLAKKLGNVVTVAKSGGDFTTPAAAMASISDARYDNPYIIVIGPGIYQLSETLVMKNYVSVIGSGQFATILRGAISTVYADQRSALVSGRGTGELSNLAIENSGGSSFSFGIFSFDPDSFVIQNVRVKVSGGNNNRGIFLDGPDRIRIFNCDIQVYGTVGGGRV